MHKNALFPLVILGAALLAACGERSELNMSDLQVRSYADGREAVACRDFNPHKNAYFGDLHVHTGISADAYAFGVRVSPDQAYRYAFGGSVTLPPLNSQGIGIRVEKNRQPLDFMGVTDHAEFFGEVDICTRVGSVAWGSAYCRSFRESTGRSFKQVLSIMLPKPRRNREVCGDDARRCADTAISVWEQTIASAERWQDYSERCERTTFIAYEYSSHRLGSNLHRNVVFRNSRVMQRPISYIEADREWDLWKLLADNCDYQRNGCDVLAIPHNSNISNGRMFAVDYPGTDNLAERRERAALRARMEPVVEIFQHKGDSECRVSIDGILGADDPLCDFERFEDLSALVRFGEVLEDNCYDGVFADSVPHLGPDCLAPLSYVRYALIEGLRQQQLLGVNPYRFGLLGSTDTHNGIGGATAEKSFPGHLGLGDDTIAKRLSADSKVAGNSSNNPGGLVGVWAEENSREAVFRALQRREVFGTSGSRIRPRFFAGWQLNEGLCEDSQRAARAYRSGVSMGSVLPAKAAHSKAPVFAAWATYDPDQGNHSVLLDKIQIIKGWVDKEGQLQQKVYDIAGGSAERRAEVDPKTCAVSSQGYKELCRVWSDPDFTAEVPAVYYARIIEQPSCRYTAWQCLELPPEKRPARCSNGELNKIVRERAWTSPVWYSPNTVSGAVDAQVRRQ